jgi:hypothetical protein
MTESQATIMLAVLGGIWAWDALCASRLSDILKELKK